jgi:uncharacterized YigZ family protein
MDDQYLTIATESIAEIKIKNSRFIGETCLVNSVLEAQARLETIRKREHAATHHCFAWQVGLEKEKQSKYSDDGEPNGTAGKPIYDFVAGAGLTNILLVVTRYFGGVKLGTGGLAHAYGDTARAVLEQSGVREHFILSHFKLDLEFSSFDSWQRTLARLGASVTNSQFAGAVSMEVAIRRSRAEELRHAFIELTSGKGLIEEISR